MNEPFLRRIRPDDAPALRRDPVDATTLARAAEIVDQVRRGGESALRAHAERLGDLAPGAPLVRPREELAAALAALEPSARKLLRRTADRLRRFAEAQRRCLHDLNFPIVGGAAGHVVTPVASAGCYAPAGRFPLASSVLMTVVPAKVAGVERVWVASPRPTTEMLAAAAVAGADAVLAVGGAQAIAALAYGAGPAPACDAIVGPGNRWVTAAKQLAAGRVAIDMLAGPSELLVLADASADPALIAADLLAQAEHDADALPALVSLDESLIAAVERELAEQLRDLPTAATARQALKNGFAVLAPDLTVAVAICDRLAPEHLEVMTENADEVAGRLSNFGALFIGGASAEVFGDYAAGPNHVLPTGGAARFAGGLSVFTFLRIRTWLKIEKPAEAAALHDDAAALARMEGLVAHARAAEMRRQTGRVK
jgi:phosphoribosyl-ATP pyrophosphohydrolase/phosphoribosyl-AMP cyclohydrolase/histidinol dehydrogenase